MNENAIHGAPKKGSEWRISLSNHYAWLQTRRWRTYARKRNSWGSEKDWECRIALANHYAWLQTLRWRTHERKRNSWAPKKGWEWRIALSNHYAWLKTRGWRTHERKRNSWCYEKGLRMENCTKQSLRMAPNTKVEDAWTKTQLMGVRKKVENGELH